MPTSIIVTISDTKPVAQAVADIVFYCGAPPALIIDGTGPDWSDRGAPAANSAAAIYRNDVTTPGTAVTEPVEFFGQHHCFAVT